MLSIHSSLVRPDDLHNRRGMVLPSRSARRCGWVPFLVLTILLCYAAAHQSARLP